MLSVQRATENGILLTRDKEGSRRGRRVFERESLAIEKKGREAGEPSGGRCVRLGSCFPQKRAYRRPNLEEERVRINANLGLGLPLGRCRGSAPASEAGDVLLFLLSRFEDL
jgi:hypothetical protein